MTKQSSRSISRSSSGRVRYAVVGLGHIAQVAVLPAFKNARSNSELTALVSDDRRKLAVLGRRHRVVWRGGYDRYDELLGSGAIDAVYIALPNSLHREYATRAAAAGIHVLCEKPMAVTEDECEAMIKARDQYGIRMMIAYRLHFDVANLRAVALAQSRRLGALRTFSSTFTMQVRDPENIRLQSRMGGGPLFDIGIYCLNAARMLFRAEPEEAFAFGIQGTERRFKDVEETVTAVLRYPGDRLAAFTCSFGASDVSAFELVGTRGSVRLDRAYDYAKERLMTITIDGRTQRRAFARRDQFAAELVYFSNCVLKGMEPEPSAEEGMADVQIIDALQQSIDSGRPMDVGATTVVRHATPSQRIDRPAVRKPRAINARGPRGD